MPAFSAAPFSNTALTCCNGAYNSPFILRNGPPSDTCPRTLKPKPVSVLYMVTKCGPEIYPNDDVDDDAGGGVGDDVGVVVVTIGDDDVVAVVVVDGNCNVDDDDDSVLVI